MIVEKIGRVIAGGVGWQLTCAACVGGMVFGLPRYQNCNKMNTRIKTE